MNVLRQYVVLNCMCMSFLSDMVLIDNGFDSKSFIIIFPLMIYEIY